MIFEHIREVFIAQHRVDFRMGVFGLRREMNKMELCPYKGHCCVFIHPNHRQVRVVGATPSGCFLVVKFFEAGALPEKLKFLTDPSCVEISKMELALLFEGAQYSNISKVPNWASCQTANKKVTKHAGNTIPKQGASVGTNVTL
jgi:IS66 Orf2 like protein